MATPLSQDEITSFTPSSLTSVVPQPAFRLRPATSRDFRRFTHALATEGLVHYDQEAVRGEVLRALKALWSEADYEAHAARLKAHWEALDQKIDLTMAEIEAMIDLMDRVARSWEPLRRMMADNQRFDADAPKIALSLYLCGVSNLDVRFRLEEGVVPLDVMDDIEAKLVAVEKKAVADGVDGVVPGLAYQQLAREALSLLKLTEDEEKNSSSPSPSASTPSGSMEDGGTATSSSSTVESSPAPKSKRSRKTTST